MAEAYLAAESLERSRRDGKEQLRGQFVDDIAVVNSIVEDKRQQTMLWQQAQYLGDSGIHSGITTNAPSVSGGSHHDDMDDGLHSSEWERSYDEDHERSSAHALSMLHDKAASVAAYDDSFAQASVPNDIKHGSGQLSPIRCHSASSQMLENAVVNLIDYQDDSDLSSCAIPELVKLLQSGNRVMGQAAAIVHQLSKKEVSRQAIMSSPTMVSALVHAIEMSDDTEIQHSLAGTMHNLSHHRQGLLAIYKSSGIPALVKLLSSPVESTLFYSITTLHNLLLHQEGSKDGVRHAGGLQKMVALLRCNNVKFLAITADCIQILVYGNQESKLIILASGGPRELVRLMRSYTYEKLLWTASRVLKVLSVCAYNKPAIVEAGGMQALAAHLRHPSGRLVQNCLWTLRNLSDAATRIGGVDVLLRTLVNLLSSTDCHQATCATGILANLTCDNQRNKTIVSQAGGVEALTHIILRSGEHDDIVEPAVCALRHLTSRHSEAEQAQNAVRLHYGFAALVRLVQPSNSWSLVKAVIGLLRNLALCSANQASMREHGAVACLVQLLLHAQHIGQQQQVATTPAAYVNSDGNAAVGARIAEIVQGTLGALHILAREPNSRAIIRSFDCIPLFVELLSSPVENIQHVAAGVLCELASDKEGVECIEQTRAVGPLMELLSSSSESIATYAAAILFRLSERVPPSRSCRAVPEEGLTRKRVDATLCPISAGDTPRCSDSRAGHRIPASATDQAQASGDVVRSRHPVAADDVFVSTARTWCETDL